MNKRPMSGWQKDVRKKMIDLDMCIAQLSREIGIERTQLSRVINESSIAPEIAKLVNDHLEIKTKYPYDPSN